MTQRFEPQTKVNVVSQVIRLPNAPTENKDKVFILRLLVVERIRAYMDSLDFQHLKDEIYKRHVKVPPYYETEELQRDYFGSETLELNSLYDRIELDPLFKEDFMSLKPYKGHKWELRSTTEHAILLTIEI